MHDDDAAHRAWSGIAYIVRVDDFAQLPPVKEEPIHVPTTAGSTNAEAIRGYDIYREFDHAIFLREVVRQERGRRRV